MLGAYPTQFEFLKTIHMHAMNVSLIQQLFWLSQKLAPNHPYWNIFSRTGLNHEQRTKNFQLGEFSHHFHQFAQKPKKLKKIYLNFYLITFSIFAPLSVKKQCHFSLGISHWFKISTNNLAMFSPVCTPGKWRIAKTKFFLFHCLVIPMTVRLNNYNSLLFIKNLNNKP